MDASLDEYDQPTAFDPSSLRPESSQEKSVRPHEAPQETSDRDPQPSRGKVPRPPTVSTSFESPVPPRIKRRSAERLKHHDSAKPTATTRKPSRTKRQDSRLEHDQRSRRDSSDPVTFELQYPPRKFSKTEDSSVSSPTVSTRQSATIGNSRRTILEDKKRTCKPVSHSISEESLRSPVRKRPVDVDEGERPSSCQRSEIITSSMQRPLVKQPRPSRIVPVSSELEMAPLIKSAGQSRSNHQEKIRQADEKVRIQSTTSLEPGGRQEEESRKSNGSQGKSREAISLSAPGGTGNRRFPSTPGSPEPEHIVVEVVQASEGLVLESWRRILAKERLLYPLAFSLCLLLVLVLTILIPPFRSTTSRTKVPRGLPLPTCSSASCLQNAVYLNQLLSWDEVDPCDDFYAFVCRHWTSHSHPSSEPYPVSADDDYAAFLERRLYALLQNASQTTMVLQPLQDLYEKCADVKRAEDEGWNLLLELMFNVSLEGFPFTPPVRKSMSVWKAAAKILRKTGSSALLSVHVSKHPSERRDVVSVGAPEMMTSGGGVDIDEAARLYTTAAFSAIRTLGKDFLPSSLALNVVKLATEIEELSVLSTDKSSPALYKLHSMPELVDFLGEVFRRIDGTPSIGLDSDVLVFTPRLVSRVLEIIRKADTHTVMNYLGVRLMIDTSPFVPHANLTDAYGALLYGKRWGLLPRWQLCIRVVDRALFPLVLFSLFTDLKLHLSMRRFVDLVYEVIAEFLRGIDNTAFFEDRSQIAIRNLLSSTETRVLGPSWINSPTLVDSFATSVPTITGARRGLESYVATYEYTFVELLKRGSGQRWSRSAFTADCWYEPNPRTIYVPLLAFNITQAFDNNIDALQLSRVGPRLDRCIFDALLTEGDSSNGTTGWLTEETRSKMQEAERCFGTHKTKLGLFNRVRDFLSARFAYAHFERSMKTSDRVLSLRLRGDRVLSESQLFFVYLMLQACEKGDHVSMNSPTLAGRRLFVALRNGGDFSIVYNCSAGSGMSPRRKCAAV